jgi:hypothetical protein
MSKAKKNSADPAKWPIKLLSIRRLLLDPENPRLATGVKRPTQPELIKTLLDHEDVFGLIVNIARLGYFPNEPLVAVKDGANWIAVEGNRRLAALKLLDNPGLAPPEFQARIQQQADLARRETERVPVVMAPSRTAIVPLLIARHKGEVTKSWTSVMQARYVQGRIEERGSIEEVVKETGLERIEVVRALRDAKLYDVIRSLPLPTEVESIVEDPRRFAFTTLQRLFESSPIQSALGVKFDDAKGFETSLRAEEFQRLLSKIVSDVASGNITSRTHNTTAEVAGYVKKLDSSIGKSTPTKGKKTTADDLVDPAKLTPKPPKSAPRAARKKAAPAGLIPRGFRVDVVDERIQAIAEELKRLNLALYPNAAAITFRSLIDMAVSKYMEDCGELRACIAALSKKSARPPDWVPSLKQQLNHILATSTIPLGPEARKGLQKFVSGSAKSLTLEELNWFTHARYVPPTVDELRSFWTTLTPLMELTLQRKEDSKE